MSLGSKKERPIKRDLRSVAPQEPEKSISQEQFRALAAKVDGLEGLTRDVLTGIKDKVAPRIDSIEGYLSKGLREELLASFNKQAEGLKAYVDSKAAPGAAAPKKDGGIIGFLTDQIKEAGGLGKLIGNFGGGGTGDQSLVMDIRELEKLVLERQRAVTRNILRNTIGLPPLPLPEAATTATGAVTLVHG